MSQSTMCVRAFVSLLAIMLPALALDPAFSISQYAKRHWRVEDGLPQNYVTSIAQAADGYLIVGTSGGVARFDGYRFTPLVLNPATGVTREWINQVVPGVDGSLWIASRDNGLYRHRGGRTEQQEGWKRAFNHLLRLEDGTMAGLGEDGFYTWTSGALRPLGAGYSATDPSWQGLVELPDSSWLGATNAGIVRVQAGTPSLLVKSDPAHGKALTLAAARDGSTWVGTTRGLFRLTRGGAGRMTRTAGVAGPVVAILEDSAGIVWAGTWGHGLFRITRQGVTAWTAREGFPDDFVHALFEDSEANLWIGTRAGLSRWKSGPVAPFGPPEAVNGQFFTAVTGNAAGDVWCGTWRNGLYLFRGGVPSKVALPEPDLSFLVRTIAPAADGTLWLSDWHGAFFRLRQGVWRRYTERELGYAPAIHAVSPGERGSLWVGSTSGLHEYPSGEPAPDGKRRISGRIVEALLPAAPGKMYAGTSNGLFLIQPERVTAIPGLPDQAVTSLSQDAAGRIWVTTRANGVSRLTGLEARTFDQRHGLPALPLFGALDDGAGSLWLSSPAGIFEVPHAAV